MNKLAKMCCRKFRIFYFFFYFKLIMYFSCRILSNLTHPECKLEFLNFKRLNCESNNLQELNIQNKNAK